MQEIIDPLQRKAFADCFYLQIPLIGACNSEIAYNIANAMQLERSVEAMLDGSMNIEDLLESVEDLVPAMDQYVEEVETNLEEMLLILP